MLENSPEIREKGSQPGEREPASIKIVVAKGSSSICTDSAAVCIYLQVKGGDHYYIQFAAAICGFRSTHSKLAFPRVF